ncbi:MAG TPA: CocE/NonD family hydrolase [Baekduia sp.]|nr:CocE/NonD family hydrolase [Baekduia sp.]
MRRPAVLLVLAALLAAAAPAAAGQRSTHRVGVTAPDEAGQPVALDVDVRVPDGAAPERGWPLVALFHGGGGTKDSAFDARAAEAFTARGSVTVLYTARGHGGSSGQTTVIGPKEVRDLFDVLGWVLDRHPIDRARLALWGYSQGGLHTNLAQAWATDRALNPRRLRFAAVLPSSTPDRVFDALVEHGVVKLSFGAALVALYSTSARPSPQVHRWIATAAADQPPLYGTGGPCDMTGHDTPTSTMRADLAWRSMACRPHRLGLPTFWLQQFDDALFPAEMAVRTLRRRPHRADRLVLGTGGHGAPGAAPSAAGDALRAQVDWLDAVLAGRAPAGPAVTYYARDTQVRAAHGIRQWPEGAWVRRDAPSWPPPGVRLRRLVLARGAALEPGGPPATTPLAGTAVDVRHDSAATTAAQALPNGTTLTGAMPALAPPGGEAVFASRPHLRTRELAGTPVLHGTWTPAGPDSQLVVRLFDEAPDGTRTLLSRGVAGLRGALPGHARQVRVRAGAVAALLHAGHRLVLRVAAGDATFYKPFPGAVGGVLADARLAVPLR